MKLTGISYNPKTGVISRHGEPVIAKTSDGYIACKVNGKQLKGHRVAWYLAYGYWPSRIDHINRDKTDNRLVNLREATTSTNALNTDPSIQKGVNWVEARQCYQATYRGKWLGYADDYKSALALRKKEELHA